MTKSINIDDENYEYIELADDEELPDGFEFVEDDIDLDTLLQNETADDIESDVDKVSLDSLFDSSDADVNELLDKPIEDFDDETTNISVDINEFADVKGLETEIDGETKKEEYNTHTIEEMDDSEHIEASITPVVEEIKEETFSNSPAEDKTIHITENSGFVISSATEFVLELENEDKLKNWQLLLWKQKSISMSKDKGELVFDNSPKKANFVTLFQEGQRKVSLFNSPQISWQNASADWQKADVSSIFGDMNDKKGMLIDEVERIYPLINMDEFEYTRAILISTNVCCIFSNLKKYKIEYSFNTEEERANQNNLRWFSGSLSDEYFEYSSASELAEVVGEDNKNIIYVDVGSSFYGWNVTFDNGVFMSLKDVQEYQKRNGKLPYNSGTISYGSKQLTFSNINKIIAGGERIQYFSYGR